MSKKQSKGKRALSSSDETETVRKPPPKPRREKDKLRKQLREWT